MLIHRWAEAYKKAGFNVLAIPKNSKGRTQPWEDFQKMDMPIEYEALIDSNIAILQHEKNIKFVIVDVDKPHAFLEFLSKQSFETEEATLTGLSNKGFHLLYRVTNINPFSYITTGWGEIRCTGYTIVAPSVYDGFERAWVYGIPSEIISLVTSVGKNEAMRMLKILEPEDFEMYIDFDIPELPSWGYNFIENHAKIEKRGTYTRQELVKRYQELITSVLEPFYKEGFRHDIILHLSALLRKSVHQFTFEETLEIIEPLIRNDEEKKDRVKAVETTYSKEIEEINYSNLLTIFKHILGNEDTARTIYYTLWKELKPTKMEYTNEIIIEYKRLSKQTVYIIIDYNADRVYIGRSGDKEPKITKIQDIYSIAPVEFVQNIDLLTETLLNNELVNAEEDLIAKNQLTIVFKDRGVLSQESAKDIRTLANKLAERGYVLVDREKVDVLSFIFDYFKSNNAVKTETKLPYRGVFWLGSNFVVNIPQLRGFNPEATRRAIALFEDFVRQFYLNTPHHRALITELVWAVGSLLSFSYKILGKHGGKFLYKLGRSSTGKTAISKVWGYILGVPHNADMGGARGFSFASFSNLVSSTALPIAINEPEVFLNDKGTSVDKIVSVLKSYPETVTLRLFSREGNKYTQYTLAPIVFNSNVGLPPDQALIKRCYVLHMEELQILDKERIERYNRFIQENGRYFIEIGKAIAEVIQRLTLQDLTFDVIEDGLMIWKRVYQLVGMQLPEWFVLDTSIFEDSMEYGAIQELTEFRLKALNLIQEKVRGFLPTTPELRGKRTDEMLRTIIQNNLLMNYFCAIARKPNQMDIFFDFFKELGWNTSMQRISERLKSYGLENTYLTVYGTTKRQGARIRVNIEDFISWLIGYDMHDVQDDETTQTTENKFAPMEEKKEPQIIGEELVIDGINIYTILNDTSFIHPNLRTVILKRDDKERVLRQLYHIYLDWKAHPELYDTPLEDIDEFLS